MAAFCPALLMRYVIIFRKPLKGLILGDSGYMIRDWLMTPILNPATQSEKNYNFAHSSTRTTIERYIGVAKRRWHCLRCGLRMEPARACQVICFLIHLFCFVAVATYLHVNHRRNPSVIDMKISCD